MRLNEIGEKTYLDKGQYGVCYELQDGNVLKLFNTPLEVSKMYKFHHFLKYKNESFLFPFEFIYDEKYFYGYISKKALGFKLSSKCEYLSLERLSNHMLLLEKDLDYISNGKIELEDLNIDNVIYDGNKLSVIDFDFYRIRRDLIPLELKERNNKYYRIGMSDIFLDKIKRNNKSMYIIDKIVSYKYDSNKKMSEIIIAIKEEIEKCYKEKVDTIDDLNTILKR